MWEKKSSDHYEFYYKKNSTAEVEIDQIIKIQENCYAEITSTLMVHMNQKLTYYLLETPEEVGELFGDHKPCNGFTRLPNRIYAVYNPKVKCIGFHEDVHIISYITLNRPNYNFIREGLAMYFDEKWQGISNESWVKYYIEKNKMPKLNTLQDNHFFHQSGEWTTYPISGAFTKYLVQSFGMEKYKQFYTALNHDIEFHYKIHFNKSIEQLEKEFIQYIGSTHLPVHHKKSIDEKLIY